LAATAEVSGSEQQSASAAGGLGGGVSGTLQQSLTGQQPLEGQQLASLLSELEKQHDMPPLNAPDQAAPATARTATAVRAAKSFTRMGYLQCHWSSGQ
jgi:hypothetical protein